MVKGERLVVIGALGEKGLIEPTVIRTNKKETSADYHGEMRGDVSSKSKTNKIAKRNFPRSKSTVVL